GECQNCGYKVWLGSRNPVPTFPNEVGKFYHNRPQRSSAYRRKFYNQQSDYARGGMSYPPTRAGFSPNPVSDELLMDNPKRYWYTLRMNRMGYVTIVAPDGRDVYLQSEADVDGLKDLIGRRHSKELDNGWDVRLMAHSPIGGTLGDYFGD